MPFSAEQKRKAAEREVGLRKYVFPNRVSAHKMTQKRADFEIAIMQEIADDYRKLEARESPTLFTKTDTADGVTK